MQPVSEEDSLLGDDDDVELYNTDTFVMEPPKARTSSGMVVSSLDFERIINQYSIQAVRDQWMLPALPSAGNVSERTKRDTMRLSINTKRRLKRQKRRLLGYTGRTATRWFLTVLAGLLTGMTSMTIVQMSGSMVRWRSRNLQYMIISPEYSDLYVLTVFTSLNVALALMASWLCVGWVPQATGSGISAVKAYLNGIRGLEKFTRLPLFIVKVVGTILSVSSGLAVGQEGPLIHIGAIMGSGCSKISGVTSKYLQKWSNWCPEGCCCCRSRRVQLIRGPTLPQRMLTWTTTELSHFATDAERRDLVSIGASVGFAASFGAPIGGLLFILDDISSYFSRNLLLRILVANAVGTFCLAVQHGDLSNYSVINLGHYKTVSDSIFVNRVEEIPLYILLGAMGGILGGAFCWSFMFLRRNITGRFPPRGQGRAKWQLLEVALVSILTSLLIFYLPSQKWACKPIPDGDDTDISYREQALENNDEFNLDFEKRNRFFCPPGEINELANMLFGSRIEAIKRILTDPTQFKLETLLAVGTVFYFLMTITFGIAIPSGIFTPTVLIGASWGGAAGIVFERYIDEEITPSTFALLGVAALLAGIQRSTVSVAVILVEGTGQIKVLTPAIIVVVVARYVAGLLHKKGVFEAVMEIKKLPYLDHEDIHRRYDAIEVGDILADLPVESVGPRERAQKLVDLLKTSSHHGFPVVDPDTGKFLGLVRRDQIAALLECGVFNKALGDNATSAWTRPESGVDKTPLMRWAYHINDDRYDYIRRSTSKARRETASVEEDLAPIERAPRYSLISSPKLQVASYSALPTEFADIEQNQDGLVYVAWLNPDYAKHWVNIGAVMNRGAFCVNEFCPVSKAYKLFTSMGLRHLIVLGGESGGQVVGVLSRANLIASYIKEKTGV